MISGSNRGSSTRQCGKEHAWIVEEAVGRRQSEICSRLLVMQPNPKC